MLRWLALLLVVVPALAQAAVLADPIELASEVMHLRINGLGVNSRAFTSTLGPTPACALLERHWQETGTGGRNARCRRAGRWLLISHRVNDVLQTAQIEARGNGSGGYLSDLDPRSSIATKTRPQLPMPAGARLVNAVQSVLSHDMVTQFTIELPWTPAASLMRLRNAARELGWVSVAGASAGVADFQQGALAARAVLAGSSHGCTLVLVEHRPAGAGR